MQKLTQQMNEPYDACPYANILGVPGQGVHAHRTLGVATADVVLTIALSVAIHLIWRCHLIVTFAVLVLLGEVLHYAFGVNTAVINLLGLSSSCGRWRTSHCTTEPKESG